MIALVVVILCAAAMGLAQPATNAQVVPVPGLQLPTQPGVMYLATRNVSPGVVLCVTPGGVMPVFTRPANNLTSFAFGRIPKGLQAEAGMMSLVFCNGISQKSIWRAVSPINEALLLTVRDYVREVAFGPRGGLYFSHSTGAAADGRIMGLTGGPPALYTKIELAKIDGFWAGNFAFAPGDRLFVSNGNVEGAKIWKYTPGGVPDPTVVFKDTGSILGFWFLNNENFLYTNGSSKVLKGHIGGSGPDGVAYENEKYKFCDVVVR